MTPITRRTWIRNSVAAGFALAARASAWAAGQASRRSKAEWSTSKDQQTGVEVAQLTNYPGDSHHFYFTNPGWYDGDRKLLFSSARDNRTNLHGLDLATGEIEQLTDLEPVPLPREVEFLRACKNPAREEAYFWHDRDLFALDLRTKQTRRLHQIEAGWCQSMTNCAADGRHVYFGIWEDQSSKFRVDLLRGYVGFKETFAAHPLSKIVQVAVDNGQARTVWEEKHWIGHVNTSPTQRHLLTFCHEGPWNLVDQRIWGLDAESGKVWKIRPTTGKETVGHEYWYADGLRIGYHGADARGQPMIGRIRHDGEDRFEASFPLQASGGCHIFSNDEKLIVGDAGGVIQLWRYDGNAYEKPRVLCRHDSTMRIQQAHPHPRISPDGRYVIFTSDRSGHCNLYKVNLVEFDSLPLADAK
jgi:oligogalacturonide lyase